MDDRGYSVLADHLVGEEEVNTVQGYADETGGGGGGAGEKEGIEEGLLGEEGVG